MDKKRKILIACVIVTVIVGGIAFLKYMSGGSMLTDSTKGYIDVTCDRMIKDSVTGVYITVSEGQKLVVESKLSRGAISLKLERVKDENVDSQEKDEDNDFEINEEFKGNQISEFEVLPGEYSGWCKTNKTTTGTLKVYTE